MNKRYIIKTVALKTGCTQTDVEKILNSILECIKELLKNNLSVTLSNFGVFSPKRISGRTLTHPITGKVVVAKPKVSVKFKPAPGFLKKNH